ncbi:MAG: acetate uptake transporter [Desulfuromusa sp.]|nr:acetate uptake transporter [Desulfuromusa sp.]
MKNIHLSSNQNRLPGFSLLALGASLFAYVLCKTGRFDSSTFYIGLILLITGGIQIATAVRAHQQRNFYAAATLLPLGIFWLSIIGCEVFPKLGFGSFPNSLTMFFYLSLWASFVAILFLRSFRQRLTMQFLYGTMMAFLLSLSLDQLREDNVFLVIGCVFGLFTAAIAVYTAIVQFLRRDSEVSYR